MTITINFDMDGTLADLYGNANWLNEIRAEKTEPYANASPLLSLSALARLLNKLQKNGYKISVISWLSKCGSAEYDEAVAETKKNWLKKHLPSVHWDEIHIVPYGTPKENFSHTAWDILFDDEKENRENWIGDAYDVKDILEILKTL